MHSSYLLAFLAATATAIPAPLSTNYNFLSNEYLGPSDTTIPRDTTTENLASYGQPETIAGTFHLLDQNIEHVPNEVEESNHRKPLMNPNDPCDNLSLSCGLRLNSPTLGDPPITDTKPGVSCLQNYQDCQTCDDNKKCKVLNWFCPGNVQQPYDESSTSGCLLCPDNHQGPSECVTGGTYRFRTQS